MASLLLSILALGAFKITALCGLFALFTGLTALYFVTIGYPSNLPRVRERKGATRFSLTTRLAYFTNCKSLYDEAYEKVRSAASTPLQETEADITQYLKHGRACLTPGLGFHDDLFIPPSSIRWLSSQSDSVFSSVEGVLEIDQVDYNIGTKCVTDNYPANYIKRDMTANAERIAMSIADELKPAFHARFGNVTDTWKEINVLNSMKLVVAQYSSRFTVGLPLCRSFIGWTPSDILYANTQPSRNEQYLVESIRNVDLFVVNSGIVGAMPKILRAVIGKMFAIPLSYRRNKMKREFKPIFQQRMELLKESQNEDEPQDLLQAMLRFAQAERPVELNIVYKNEG
jgi:hypothetical protein